MKLIFELFGRAGCLLSFALAQSALGAVIVDQQALVGPPTMGRVSAIIGNLNPPPPNPRIVNSVLGQTVTAGVTGILKTVEIQGPFSGSLAGSAVFSLFDGDLTSGGTLLGTRSVDLASIALANSQFVSAIDVSSFGLGVTPGSIFSFSLSYLGPANGNAGVTIGNLTGFTPMGQPIFAFNQYAAGTGFQSGNGNPLRPAAWDLGFRTYVDAIPEPGNWALMIVGFGLIGSAMRRRRETLSVAWA